MESTISQFVDTTFLASQEVHNGRKSLQLVFLFVFSFETTKLEFVFSK